MDIGQGNGLAGVLEIVTRNGGDLQIWTGDAVYRVVRGEIKGFVRIPQIVGTGVAFSLNTCMPVDLRDTWIAGLVAAGGAFLSTPTWMSTDLASSHQQAQVDDNVIDVAGNCASTEMRGPAQRLRQAIVQRLSGASLPLTLDFSRVEIASSSFLDELLGRLVSELGTSFHRKLQITGMSDLVQRMANVVIEQRLQGHPPAATDLEGARP